MPLLMTAVVFICVECFNEDAGLEGRLLHNLKLKT